MLLETDKALLGKKFRHYRKIKKMTQFELAEKVGLNEKQISRIESGLNYPTYVTFVKLIEILEIDINYFLKDNDTEKYFSNNEIFSILKKSNESEIKIFTDTIKSLKKSLKNYKLS